MNQQPLLGKGLYTLPEAARILKAQPRTLRRWVCGYTQKYRGEDLYSEPIVTPEIKQSEGETVISFKNLIECLFINLFRKENVSMPVIRAAAQEASRQFGTKHPFAVKRFDTDGNRIFATLEYQAIEGMHHTALLEDLNLSQFVMEQLARPYFRHLEHNQEGAMRYWPLGQKKHIVLDPHRSFGKSIDYASGVQTFVLYGMARSGEPVDRIAKWYRVTESAVHSAIEYESSLSLPKVA